MLHQHYSMKIHHTFVESARRYVESDVNIHYRTPVRYEIKDPISDTELVQRQEQAKKNYQEERRRKYLQELQDLNNRRHTDNFTLSEKSPIPLNRYDDFGSVYDYVPKSPNYPKTVARALYDFQGQTSRFVAFFISDIPKIRLNLDLKRETVYSYANIILFYLFHAENLVSKKATSFTFDVKLMKIGTRVNLMQPLA